MKLRNAIIIIVVLLGLSFWGAMSFVVNIIFMLLL